MSVSIRPTRPDEIDFVLAAERDPEASSRITVREREEHLAALAWAESDHLMILDDGEPVGFALLFGVGGKNRSIEIRTIVVTRPGAGIGRQALRLIIDRAFTELGAHRVWLDVIDHNERARRAYAAVGFRDEGTMRECWVNPAGEYESLVIASILADEWPPTG